MAHGKVNGNNIVRLPSKQLKSLTDEELMLAYQCAGAFRQHLQSMPQAPQEPANDESRG